MRISINFFKVFLVTCLITIIFSPASFSADLKDTAGITMSIPSICKLTIEDSDLIVDLLQDASGEAAYEAGYFDGDENMPRLIVDSNINWKLSVGVSFDWSIVGSYQKATEDIRLKVTSSSGHQTGFSDFTPLSMMDQEIATYTHGVSNDTYNCQYRILLDWEKDIPGIYVTIITYTLSTQPI